MKSLAVVLMLTLACACNSNSSSDSKPAPTAGTTEAPPPASPPGGGLGFGQWGGQGISMVVEESAAAFQIDCGFGTINQAIKPDANGNFQNSGTIGKESIDPPPPAPATFIGNISGNTMNLKIIWKENNQDFSTEYVLKNGDAGIVISCN